jgi:cyclopropane fatty-acyl-phospholipid synthase-like methyltransferase
VARRLRSLPSPQVSPDEYDEAYYRTTCAGHEEWSRSNGAAEAAIYPTVLERAGFREGMTVLDVGAGRGELVAVAAAAGARWSLGVEYAPAAARLARNTIGTRGVSHAARVVLADARRLPLPDGCVDLVFMLDVIEHLAPDELALALAEAHRVLRPGGRLYGHTLPTRTIYDVTYRSMRVAAWLRGARWPTDPRNEFEHRMHVNEQSRGRLRRSVRRAGFRSATVRLGEWLYTDFLPSERAKAAYRRLARHRLTAPLAVADLWVDAVR